MISDKEENIANEIVDVIAEQLKKNGITPDECKQITDYAFRKFMAMTGNYVKYIKYESDKC